MCDIFSAIVHLGIFRNGVVANKINEAHKVNTHDRQVNSRMLLVWYLFVFTEYK